MAARTHAFSPGFLPTDFFFSARTYAALVPSEQIPHFLGLFASKTVDFLLKVSLGRSGHPEFVTNVVRALPVPDMAGEERTFGSLARAAWHTKRDIGSVESIAHAFDMPALLASPGASLADRAAAWAARERTSEETVAVIQAEIDDLAFRPYCPDAADRAALTSTLATESTADAAAESSEEKEEETVSAPALAADLLAYALGAAFGRWDVRVATGQKPAPPDPDPFDPLPVCPPGMLQDAAGLPATPTDVQGDYPLRISWLGILVDDPHHPEDIGQRLREFFELLWPDRADAMEQEACALLGVKSLREYFHKPAGFFADHLKRYSKSRRQAPIYWPLSSPKGLYTVWLYYHRLTADTLFSVLRDHVKPKLEYEERRANQLKQEAGATPSPSHRREIVEAEGLVEDVRAFLDELSGAAALFRPNLNDGVIINHAPLWRMIGLPKWRKDVHAVWEELVNGKYDWAHLAMHLWPGRVVPKCATDRSLAIAHGLEDVFWFEGSDGKWKSRPQPTRSIADLVHERTSPAVKAALKSLTEAPVARSGESGRRPRSSAVNLANEQV